MSKRFFTVKNVALISFSSLAWTEAVFSQEEVAQKWGETQASGSLPIVPILVGLAFLAILIAVVVVVIAKNKNKKSSIVLLNQVQPMKKAGSAQGVRAPVVVNIPTARFPINVPPVEKKVEKFEKENEPAPVIESAKSFSEPKIEESNIVIEKKSENENLISDSRPSPQVTTPQSSRPLFDANQLEEDLDSIFSDPNEAPVIKESGSQKSPLFDSVQLDQDLDAIFVEVGDDSQIKAEAVSKKGLFDSDKLDGDLDSLLTEQSPVSGQKDKETKISETSSENISADLFSLFEGNTEEQKDDSLADFDFAKTSISEKLPDAKSVGLDFDSFDFMGSSAVEKKESNSEKKSDFSDLSLESLNSFAFGEAKDPEKEVFSLPSFDLSSLTNNEKNKNTLPQQPALDLTSTMMSTNLEDFMKTEPGNTALPQQPALDLTSTMMSTNLEDFMKTANNDSLPQFDLGSLSDLSFSDISEKKTEENDSSTPKIDGVISIGKMQVDQNALEEIIRKAEKGGRAGLTTTQVISAVKGKSLDTLLIDINNVEGVMGSIIVGKDGLVIANTMPADVDKDLVGALTSSLFTNIDVQTKKLKKNNVNRLTVQTEIGTYILTEIEMGTLVVFGKPGLKIELTSAFKAIASVTGKR